MLQTGVAEPPGSVTLTAPRHRQAAAACWPGLIRERVERQPWTHCPGNRRWQKQLRPLRLRLSLRHPLLDTCVGVLVAPVRRRRVHDRSLLLLTVHHVSLAAAAAGLSLLTYVFSSSFYNNLLLWASLCLCFLPHLTVVQFDYWQGKSVHRRGDDGGGLPLSGLRCLLTAIAVVFIDAIDSLCEGLHIFGQATRPADQWGASEYLLAIYLTFESDSSGGPGTASKHPTCWECTRRPFCTLWLGVIHHAVQRWVLLWSYAVQIYHCGVDIPQVYDFSFLVSVFMEDGVSTNEEKDTNSHHKWSEDFQVVWIQIVIQEVTEKATVTGRAGNTGVRMSLVEQIWLARGRLTTGQVGGNLRTFGIAHPAGVKSPGSAALLVFLLVLAGPVAQYSHGNPNHKNYNSNSGHQTSRGAEIEFALHHHHIVFLLFLGFPLPFVLRSVFRSERILAPVHAQQATRGYHGGDYTTGLSLSLWEHKTKEREDKPEERAERMFTAYCILLQVRSR